LDYLAGHLAKNQTAIESYARNQELSSFDTLRTFENNIEIGTTASYSSAGDAGGFSLASLFGFSLDGLPDSRGFSLGIRYSLSGLPINNGYEPRQADERVGYFLSAYRAPLQFGQSDPFVRLIHRWHLEKATPGAALSEPVEPIVFWIENTVPPEYRAAIENGILMWNEGFEQAGFRNAIEVKQMPDNADWDPSDVRYNVVRWSDSLGSRVAGLGPSRVNPLTGEILDADIILDANVVRTVLQQYRTRGLEGNGAAEATDYLQLCGQVSQDWYVQWLALQKWGTNGPAMTRNFADELSRFSHGNHTACSDYVGTQQAAFGALALTETSALTRSQLDDYLQQYLLMLTSHEVGHTLGLRHNFAGSGSLSPAQLNDTDITRAQGMVSSVMDYVPPNIAPPGVEQGDFFPTRLGAYDKWAIEYGYKPVEANGLQFSEADALNTIADRADVPELAFLTDEDVRDFIDPEVSPWDLSSDPLQFAEWQMENAQSVWSQLNRLSVSRSEGFGGLRRRVDTVFRYFDNNTSTLTNYVGGQRFRRVNPWESDRAPLEPIPVAKQREALAALNEKVFAADAFQFSSRLLNQLPPERWSHEGTRLTLAPLDYPIFENVLALQSFALSNLVSATRLGRVRDLEYKADTEDILTIAEVFDSIYQGVWTELASPSEAVQDLSSLRRGLQRHHLSILSNLVLRKSGAALAESQSFLDFVALAVTLGAPDDARVLARYQLGQMYDDVNRALRRSSGNMDITTRAHWEEVRDRIDRILDAPLTGA
ncbi:MAG: zinc-dependent metalloprotease, partial [Cyanobacteria bacterium J06573_11]